MTEDEWRELAAPSADHDADVAAGRATRCPPDVRWAIESTTICDVESPYCASRAGRSARTVAGDYFAIKKLERREGPPLRAAGDTLGTPVVVIGQEVADHFFPNLDPIGRELRFSGIPYTVIGVPRSRAACSASRSTSS